MKVGELRRCSLASTTINITFMQHACQSKNSRHVLDEGNGKARLTNMSHSVSGR
jgi:hypothetical protein